MKTIEIVGNIVTRFTVQVPDNFTEQDVHDAAGNVDWYGHGTIQETEIVEFKEVK
jgi:hypothetical protein